MTNPQTSMRASESVSGFKLPTFIQNLLIALALCAAMPLTAQVPDLTNGEPRTDDLSWNLGPTGMSGWFYRPNWNAKYAGWNTEFARQIEVMTVDSGSPADGILQLGDVILGADGTGAEPVAFASDARKAFADAIGEAEANSPAILKLLVWRAGTTSTVSLTLETLGAYSATAPYNCPKSAAVLEKGLDAVMASGGTDEFKFSLVTLLAGNDPSNPDNAARMARAQQEAHALILTPEQIDEYTAPVPLSYSKIAWTIGFKLTALAEYYLHTGDTAVYESLRAYAIAAANGQTMFGTSGHQFAKFGADGSLNGPYGIGYGVVNSANMQCFLGLTLARQAGVTDQAVLDAVERASNFYGSYVDRGTIPYGEHGPGKDYGDNGKSGIAALCFKAEGTRNYDANYYATLAASAAHNLDAGHQGPYLNYLWTPLGVNAAGEEAMAAFFAEQRWRFDLARNHDGTFTYNSYQNGGQGGYGGPTWSGKNFQIYQAMLLPYAAPLRETYLTGKNTTDPAKWLSASVLDDVQVSSGYDATTRTTNELLADLGIRSPVTRIATAVEIGLRTSEHATLLPTLHSMASDSNASLQSRMGACKALGAIKNDSSVPPLVGLLTDPNDRIKWAAAAALREFSVNALMAELDAIMTACIAEGKPVVPIDPEDPVHLTHQQIVELLFDKMLRNHDLVGIDHDLLIPAIRAGAIHPMGGVRSDVGLTYPKLNREEVESLADILVDGTLYEAPADRMFSVAVRMAGLNAMQSHNFTEGVPMAMILALELNSTKALDTLIGYAADSLLAEPDHEVLKWLDIVEAGDTSRVFTAASNWPEPGTHNHIQWVRDAINSDPGPYEKPEPFKRIHTVYADDATLTLPDYWTGLHAGAYDFAKGDSVYTWRKIHGAGEVSFFPNGTAAAKDTTVIFDGTPGEYLFAVTMSDSRGFSEATQTVAVTLENVGGGLDPNSAPTADDQSVTAGQSTPIQILLTGSDPEGYALDYTVTSGPSHGTLSGTAPSLVYTASAGYTGSDSISFEVMDSEGQVASGTVSITVNATAPVALAIYEPFEGYPLGTNINGLSGTGEIGLAGTWTAGADIYTEDPGYTYGPLPTTGSRLWHRGMNSPGQSRPIHPDALTNSGLLADGATLWFSVLIGADDTYQRNVQIALGNASFGSTKNFILDDGADAGTGLGFEFNADTHFYAAQFFDASQSTPLRGDFNEMAAGKFVRHGDLRLVVGKISWGAASDTVEIYLPLLPEAGAGIVLPDEPSSTLVANVDQAKFDVLTISRGTNVWVDEIRFGSTLQSVLMGTLDAGGIADDGVAPAPDPMTFAIAPQVSSQNSITMTATPAFDPLGVEYHFTSTAGGGNDSGWQDSNVYTDTGLTPGVAYSYTVKARDKAPGLNETAASAVASATIPSSGTVPDLVGIEQSIAETLLADAGMALGTVTNAAAYSLTVPAGHVLSQSPVGPASSAYATAVDLEISIGQDPALPTMAPVDIVDDKGGLPVTLPATINYTLTFSKDMNVSTIDAGDFVNLAGVPITIGAINEVSPGVITIDVTPNTTEPGYVLLAIAQGAVIKDAQGNDLNTSSAIADEESIPLLRPDNYAPIVDAGADQTVNIDSAQPWSPTAISTVAWYDAADATTITQSAGAVSQWRDKSGNGLHAGQGSATNQPTYNTSDTRLNNLPTVGYDQGFKYLQTPTIASIRNVYVVTYYDDPDNSFDSHRVLFGDTANSIKMQGSAGTNDWVSGKGFDQHRDGSSTSSDLDILPMGPTLWTAKGTASHNSKAWRILGGANSFQYWEYGAVGEVILTDGTEDLETQQKIEGYLAHKWGMAANLPADHPYKASAPSSLAAVANLDGTVEDYDNDPFSSSWSLVSGPAAVDFADAAAVDTSGTFTVAGSYVLELTADDGTDQASDQVTITVEQGGDTTPPTLSGSDIVDDQGGTDVVENTPLTYTVTFNEDMDAVTVEASDFGNAGTSPVSVGVVTKTSPGIFSVEVTPTGTGTLQLQVNAGATLNDLAGNSLDTTSAIVDDTTIDVVAAPPSNNAPVFTADPFSAAAATEAVAYADSIAGSATDADTGDTLNYSKVGGPAWLSVAANGDLSGTPTSSDVGTNAFTVSVNDGNGGSDSTTLNITVNAVASNNPPVVDAGTNQSVSLSAGGGAWTPADTTSVAWYDAADASTITESGGAVSQWRDKSGNDHHANQGNSAMQPTYNSNDTRFNNLPTIGYDQGYKFLDTPNLAAIRNVYFVTYYDDPDNVFDSHRVFFSDTGNANKLQGQAGADDWVAGKGFENYKDGATSSSNLDILPMGPTLWTAKGTASHVNKTWRMLGGIQNYQYWEYGAIGEIILTDGTEDLETQQKIEGYLAHKWGTEANLPVDHPYKSAAPTGGSAAIGNLDGTISDPDSDPFTSAWSLVSGPTGVIFGDATVEDTTATFTELGTYVLELTANDGTDQASDQVTITVDDGSDSTAPTLSGNDIVDDQGGANVIENDLVTYTVTFSEDMDESTVDAGDFSNAGTSSVTIGTVTEASPGVFTVDVSPTSAGTLQLQVSAAAVLTDVAGNALDTTTAIADDTTITVDVLNVAPVWASDPVDETDADEDSAYSSSLADDASDGNSDPLAFAKISGPAWLSVASNGDLSGTPTNADVGANVFTVNVSDGIAPAVEATLNITVINTNDAPVFTANPIAGADGTQDMLYSGTLAGSATDEDVDDVLTYAKVSGPAWLSVASDGTLSGTPSNADVGANAFTVSVSDGIAPAAEATLNITVINVNDAPIVDAGADQFIAMTTDEGEAWTPLETSSVAWYDAADATTITESGGAVSQWRDKSGNDRHATQGNGAMQPSYNSSDSRLNNLPTIGYNQGYKFLDTPNLAAIRNVYVVTYYDDPDNSFDSHRVLFSDTGNTYKLQGQAGNDDWVSGKGFDHYRDGASTSSDLGILPMGPTLWTAKGTASHTNRTWRMLGGKQNYQYWEYGAIGEIILTDGNEDLATQQKIEGYLAHKWGTEANLPAGHPYKDAAPGGVGASSSAVALLNATVSDPDGDSFTSQWTVTSGPGTVDFSDESAEATDATVAQEGTYVLRLTADDGTDAGFDEVTINVDGTAPTLAGADIVDDQGGANVAENDPVTYTVTFSEAMDADSVDATDFSNAGTSSVTIGAVTEVSPGVFSVVTTPTTVGTLQLQVSAAAMLTDLAGNALDTTAAIVDDTVITVELPPATVPNVVGLAQAVAESNITAANLVVGTVTQESSATVPQGDVISQGLSSGSSVPQGSAVDLVVSLGDNLSPKLVRTTVNAVSSSSWTTVDLGQTYNSAVIIATPIYPNTSTPPVVTRIRNVSGSSFDLKLDRADGLAGEVIVDVSVVAVDEGVYTQAVDGVTMEAVKFTSTITARKNNWVAESRSFQNTYTNPVVVGQVMSANDANWSAFWSMGSAQGNPVDASNLNVGKHVGEDPNTTRANETIGYIVIESGSGSINGVGYEAAVGADTVRGIGDSSTPYTYSLSGGLASASAAALSVAGMDGGDGGWAVLGGATPITTTSISMWLDEDTLGDSERAHTHEQFSYIVFE